MAVAEKKVDWMPIAAVGIGGVALIAGLYFYMKKVYPTTDIRNVEISVTGAIWPESDIKSISISVTGPAYPTTDIKDITISVTGPEYPTTDIKSISISVTGPEYPTTDIKSISISVTGPAYPTTDIKDILILVVPIEYTITVTCEPDVGYVEQWIKDPDTGEWVLDIGPYPPGTTIMLIAVSPFPEYRFSYWSGDLSGTEASKQFTIDKNMSVVAHYVAV